MADRDLGDTITPNLTVSPYDNTTVAALVVTRPDLTTFSVGASTTDGGQTWTASSYIATAEGRWVETWTVLGTGADVTERTYYVTSALPVPWRPVLTEVADLVPERTVSVTDPTSGALRGTFDPTTRPTNQQVARIIGQAVAWVTARVGAVDPSLNDQANAVATMRAAALVEASYPVRDADIRDVARTWFEQSTQMREDLAASNAAVATSGVVVGAGLLPQWSMPDPVAWGDSLFL